jgi:LysM repeat protein
VRVWTKSACAVLAWGILLTLAIAGTSMRGHLSPAQADQRIAPSITQVTVPATLTAAARPAAAATAASPATRYVVRPGDTLSGIAAAVGVRGGWPALYAANRDVIGPDPDIIQPGTVLALPARQAPARYTVAAGDTLSGIAAALAVPGGWPALYAANRRAIGPDPDLIRPGTVLTIPPPTPAPAATRPPAPAPHSATPARHAHPAAPPASAGHRHRAAPAPATAHARAGMPRWLLTMLVAVGVLIGAAFLAELVLVIARKRRQATTDGVPFPIACASQAADPGSLPEQRARIVVADYHRVVVTHSKADDVVCVLRPPGEDPRAILRVARLVLAEDPYEKLANRLGVPASWPMD